MCENGYFTLIFCPALIRSPFILFSLRSFATVVLLRAAMRLKLSPLRAVTVFPLREEEEVFLDLRDCEDFLLWFDEVLI